MLRKITTSIFILLFLAACKAASNPPQELQGISIYPNATNFSTITDYPIYIYTVKATSAEVEKFYKEEMASAGWEYLGTGDIFNSTEMWFAKEKTYVTINFETKAKSTEIGIKIEE